MAPVVEQRKNQREPTLVEKIFGNPTIAPLIDREQLGASAVRASTAVDYIIGLVQEALEKQPADDELQGLYDNLRGTYPQHFRESRSVGKLETKNPRYKACNGF